MTIQELDIHHKERPFEPFRLLVADGRAYDVRHPDRKSIQHRPATSGAGGFSTLVNGLSGHASEADYYEAYNQVHPVLVRDEKVVRAYKTYRDLFVFTDRRLILVDKMGLTGKKQEWMFIPYKSITRFALETAGFLDWDAELRIWIAGSAEPVKKEFRKDKHVNDICKLLSHYVLA